jgi:hypothetical protein
VAETTRWHATIESDRLIDRVRGHVLCGQMPSAALLYAYARVTYFIVHFIVLALHNYKASTQVTRSSDHYAVKGATSSEGYG